MKTAKQVKQALADVFKTLKVANGYSNDLPDEHIRQRYDKTFLEDPDDDSFPKCVIYQTGGTNARRPGMQEDKELNFSVVLVVKAIKEEDDCVEMTESFQEDIENLIYRNCTLNGAVHDVSI